MANSQRPAATGLVLGKFMPPHRGHGYLLDFARRCVDRLAIVMDSLASQPIPADLRLEWLRELAPGAELFHLTEMPQDPSETVDFWSIWESSLRGVLPFQPDYVFASEPYGWRVAQVLGGTFLPVDIDRRIIPISGTAIRHDPLRHWEYIPPCVRPYFVRRICIFGPESTGKSTLAVRLADHFQTVSVPEYARTYLQSRHGEINADDISLIARGQMASEDALARSANRLLFCDTDLILTTIWSDTLFHSCPEWIREEAGRRTYDLYLLTDVDVPWVGDPVRYLPNDRQQFLDRCRTELEKHGRRYVWIRGDWDQRFRQAVEAVREFAGGCRV